MVEIIEITPEFDIHATEIAKLESGQKIIHAVIQEDLFNEMKACAMVKIFVDKASFTLIGVDDFIGTTIESIEAAYPELKGKVEIEPGIFVDKIRANKWNYKDKEHVTCYFVSDTCDRHKVKIKSSKKVKVKDIKDKTGDTKVLKWLDRMIVKEIELMAE